MKLFVGVLLLGAIHTMSLQIAPSGRKDLAIAIRTWSEDVKLAKFVAASACEIVPKSYDYEIVIITDQDSEQSVTQTFQSAENDFGWASCRVDTRIIVEDTFLMNGHIQQKYSKMTIDHHTSASLILHLDSDAPLVRWDDACFFEKGRPINDFALYSDVPPVPWKTTYKVLGIEEFPLQYEFSRLNQHMYPRGLYQLTRDRMEMVYNKSFKDIFIDVPFVGTREDLLHLGPGPTLISDFNLLGAVAHYWGGDMMIDKNLSAPAAKWREVCVAQCNSRLFPTECCLAYMNTVSNYFTKQSNARLEDCDLTSQFHQLLPKHCGLTSKIDEMMEENELTCSHLG